MPSSPSPTHAEMTEADLLLRVETISPTLSQTDAALAHALVNLITNLRVLIPSNLTTTTITTTTNPPPIDLFDALSRQLSDLQLERLSTTTSEQDPSRLWSHIDVDLEKVVALCKQRVASASIPKAADDLLPPQYDIGDYDDESLPEYEAGPRSSLDYSPKPAPSHSGDEKLRMDLEAVAMAIERLYIAAPQLHNQRVELKSSKLAELEKLERARVEAATSSSKGGIIRADNNDELEKIVELIGKASERRLRDQSVILDAGNMLERAKRKESAKVRSLLLFAFYTMFIFGGFFRETHS